MDKCYEILGFPQDNTGIFKQLSFVNIKLSQLRGRNQVEPNCLITYYEN